VIDRYDHEMVCNALLVPDRVWEYITDYFEVLCLANELLIAFMQFTEYAVICGVFILLATIGKVAQVFIVLRPSTIHGAFKP
jgi:hypothetical protein